MLRTLVTTLSTLALTGALAASAAGQSTAPSLVPAEPGDGAAERALALLGVLRTKAERLV